MSRHERDVSNNTRRPRPALFPAAAPYARPEGAGVMLRKKRIIACDTCRTRKTKCNGARPSCGECTTRSSLCVYGGPPSREAKRKLQSRNSNYEELFELIRTMPAEESAEVFSRIRAGHDVESLLSHVRGGNMLLQLCLTPETRFRYELPYLTSMPTSLQVPGNEYLESLLYEATSMGFGPIDAPPSSGQTAVSSTLAKSRKDECQSVYLKPYHVAEPCEPLLDTVQPSKWTTVSKDDRLMRALLGAYFRHEYYSFAIFHKDYFLEDMASGATDCCSSLLVNALLAYAYSCHSKLSNRARCWDSSTLGYLFHAEARRLWDIEVSKGQQHYGLPTVQAACAISCVYNMCGLDKLGVVYKNQGIAIANDLDLFRNHDDPTVVPQRLRNARQFTAWALFDLETLISWEMFTDPLVSSPPRAPLPDPWQNLRWYSEVWCKYPRSASLYPMHFGLIFKAKSDFRVILNDISRLRVKIEGRYTAAQVHDFGQRLRTWYKDLPRTLSPKHIALPAHLMLHMEYFQVVLALYQPFIEKPWTFHPAPPRIIAEADRSLQTLIRLYYLRHGFETMDTFVLSPLAKLAFVALQNIAQNDDPRRLVDIRSTLFLATKGLRDQGQSNYLGLTLYRVLMSQMGLEEAHIMQRIVQEAGTEETIEDEQRLRDVQADWVPVLVQSKEEQDERRLTRLVEQIEIGNSRRAHRVTGPSA